jgi:hypothetical protein
MSRRPQRQGRRAPAKDVQRRFSSTCGHSWWLRCRRPVCARGAPGIRQRCRRPDGVAGGSGWPLTWACSSAEAKTTRITKRQEPMGGRWDGQRGQRRDVEVS